MNKVANYLAPMLLLQGIAFIILLNLSTTTKIASYPEDTGRGVIKSMDISCQGLAAIGIGYNNPYYLWFLGLFL